jgi:DNA polymerase (family X)
MTNALIARAFDTIADILSLQDENPFRIRAYQRAAQTIMAMSEDLEMIYNRKGKEALLNIPGIGEDLAAKIEELVKTGKLKYLMDLSKKVPAGLIEITGIQGMGPKKTKFVWKKFKVKNVDELEKLAKSGKLDKQEGWGKKSVENVLQGIAAMRLHNERVALPSALAVAEQILRELKDSGLCQDLEIAGSLRRRKESIGDIDILATSKKPDKVMEIFCAFGLVDRVLARGPTRASVHLTTGINADLRVLDHKVFGAALHYFTGNKEHNIALRKRGIERGLTISEYGVYEGTPEKKGKLLASRTEADVYKAVGLPYIEPELREDRGEIQAAEKGELPDLIEVSDMKGDLHLHSNFSDGNATMTDMAKAAKAAGLKFMAFCDHCSPMGMVRGIKEENIDEYLGMVEKARKDVKGIEILAGAEVDILEDGSLYLSDKSLKKLDWVVASVHGNFKLPKDVMTRRIIKGLSNPYVRIFAHPTSRLLLKRDPIEYDIDAVFALCKEKNVALEINASIFRLDLNDVLARKAKEAGCMIAIDSDAHHPREFDYRFGITQARRGWIEKKDVINAMTFAELKKWMAKKSS